MSRAKFSPVTSEGLSAHKQFLYWACQIGGWSVFGIYQLFLLYVGKNLTLQSGMDTVFTIASLLVMSHFYRNYLLRKGWLKLLFVRLLGRIIGASFVLSLIAVPFQIVFSLLISANISAIFQPDESLWQTFIVSIITVTLLFFGWSIAYFLYHYVSSYNRNLKWEAMINEFELNQLKSQLNPHFIFNALNSVRALVDENPQNAKDSINQLSNILRNSLLMDKKKVIPFPEELNIVKDYLALECTRFEERLQVSYIIDPKAATYKVPPMMLQTLAENGIKHGIAKLKEGGKIVIQAQVKDDGKLHIIIQNSGTYHAHQKAITGYGLRSTYQRLELLYRKEASFSIKNTKDNLVQTELVIPVWNENELTIAE